MRPEGRIYGVMHLRIRPRLLGDNLVGLLGRWVVNRVSGSGLGSSSLGLGNIEFDFVNSAHALVIRDGLTRDNRALAARAHERCDEQDV